MIIFLWVIFSSYWYNIQCAASAIYSLASRIQQYSFQPFKVKLFSTSTDPIWNINSRNVRFLQTHHFLLYIESSSELELNNQNRFVHTYLEYA